MHRQRVYTVRAEYEDGQERYYVCVGKQKTTCIVVEGDEGRLLTDKCNKDAAVLPAILCRYEVLLTALHSVNAPSIAFEMVQALYLTLRINSKNIEVAQ